MIIGLLNDLVVPALTLASIWALVATTFNVLERSTKVVSFTQGHLIMWAPMATLVLLVHVQAPAPVAVIGGVLCTLGLALISERVAIRPFLGSTDLSWILTTLGAGLILGQLATVPFQAQPQFFPLGLPYVPMIVGGVRILPSSLLLFGTAVVVFVIVELIYTKTRLGRMLIAVSEDFDGARVLGISPSKMAASAMAISALVAAATGLTMAQVLLVSPAMGHLLTFTGFVAVMLGGLGSLRGGWVGGLIVGFLMQLTAMILGGLWVNTVLFAVLLMVYLLRPWGLLGRRPDRAV